MNAIELQRKIETSGLPDGPQWVNRFEINSESSDRVYIVSQNKKKRYWACSCPGFRIRRADGRKCKHLVACGLPCFEKPHEVGKLQ